jgi:hypothetical protein
LEEIRLSPNELGEISKHMEEINPMSDQAHDSSGMIT